MRSTPSLQVVRLTPPGRGAVATLHVEGPGAVDVVDAHFHAKNRRPLGECPTDRLVLGHFASEMGEEIVARRRSDQSVELHCHGGYASAAMIEAMLVRSGCRSVTWQDWIPEHYRDPIAAAAHQALAEARTEKTAAILLDQYGGALRRALDEIEEACRRGDTERARREAEVLLARAELGRHLVRPWQVVLAGGPNVGKSSLINALLGYPRAIVHHTPGTTRDVVTAVTAIDGWPVELSDTAGLHGPAEALERAGMELARQRLAEADLVVLVFDGSVPWSAADRELTESYPGAPLVHNKCDLPPSPAGRPGGLATSALTGEGIEELLAAIGARLVPDPPPGAAAVPFTDEVIEYLAALVGVRQEW